MLTDLREWVTAGDREEIRRVIRELDLPNHRGLGTFDERARVVWRYVVENIRYVGDAESQLQLDFWQFPAETVALGQGDCEDTSFLVATLLLASGVSNFCVRVVFGTLKRSSRKPGEGHVWPIYKDEQGIWRILESTLSNEDWGAEWLDADQAARAGARPHYRPELCLNDKHVWQVGKKEIGDLTDYVLSRRSRK